MKYFSRKATTTSFRIWLLFASIGADGFDVSSYRYVSRIDSTLEQYIQVKQYSALFNSPAYNAVDAPLVAHGRGTNIPPSLGIPGLLLSSETEGFHIPTFIGFTLVTAIGVFAYANLVLTPEILEGAASMRQEKRDSEIQRLIAVVHNHTEQRKSFSELRIPLEVALGVSLETYLEAVEEKDDGWDVQGTINGVPFRGEAHKALASVIKNAMREVPDMS